MKIVGILFLVTYVAGTPLLGSKKCTWGPSYWCSHIRHAKECGAVQHCITAVWEKQTVKVQSTETCTYCMLLVGTLRDMLKNKATDDKIAEKISEACKLLPAGDDRDICEGIVTEDLPIAIQMLTSKVNASMACSIFGFCKAEVKDQVKKPSPYSDVTAVAKVNVKEECTDCKKFFGDVQASITSNETISQLEQLIQASICSQIGPLEDVCDDLVKQYIPVALSFLASQCDPQVICNVIGYCSVSMKKLHYNIPIKNLFINRPPVPLQYRSSEECEICKDLINQVDELLRDKTTQDQIRLYLKSYVCKQLGGFDATDIHKSMDEFEFGPDPITDYGCEELVDEYLPTVFELLVNELDPTTFCETISICKVPGYDRKAHYLVELTHVEPAEKETAAVSNGLLCTSCKLVMQEVDTLLEKKETIREVEDLIEKICARLPDDELKAECNSFVEQYGAMVVKLLAEAAAPDTICKLIGLCSQNVEKGSKNGDAFCSICVMVVGEVQDLIANMSTETLLDDAKKVCSFLPADLSAKCLTYVTTFGPVAIDMLKNEKPKDLCALLTACNSSVAVHMPYMTIPIPEDPVPVKQKAGVSPECQICSTGLTILKIVVGQNATKESIEKVLEKACSEIAALKDFCDTILHEYFDEIIKKLLEDVNPLQICEDIGLCKVSVLQALQPSLTGILSPVDTLPLFEPKKEISKPAVQVSGCEICKKVLNAAADMLEQETTQEEIMKAMDFVCTDVLPATLADECVKFVNAYGHTAINYLLLEVDPNVICEEIKLCSSAVMKLPAPTHVKLLKESDEKTLQAGASLECELCKLVMEELIKIVGQNKSLEAIEAALEKVCTVFPDTTRGECKAFVDQYTPEIVSLLTQGLDPKEVCTKLGLCQGQLANEKTANANDVGCVLCEFVMNELDKILQKNATEEEVKAALEKVCGLLPSTIKQECDDFVGQYIDMVIQLLVKEGLDPKQVCTRLGLCQSQTSFGKTMPSETVGQCVACEFVIKEVVKYLKKNSSEKQIEALLEKACDMLPDTITAQCEAFVEQYTPVLVKALAENLDPKKVCTAVGLCKGKVISGPLECDLCKFAVTDVKEAVDKNTTVQECEDLLRKVCGVIPDKQLSAECQSVVLLYVPAILDLLKEDMNPLKICQTIGACNYTLSHPTKETDWTEVSDDTLYFKPVKSHDHHLLGEKECTYGPAFWCASMENARKCNAMEHCQRHVWNRD